MSRKLLAVGLLLTLASLAWTGIALADPPTDPPNDPTPGWDPDPPGHLVTFCHVAGLAEDPANTVTITADEHAVFGPAGHFSENGTPNAGHEQDYLGPCEEPSPSPTTPPPTTPPPTTPPPTTPPPTTPPPTTPPPTEPPAVKDVCPNIPGIQEEVPEGYHKRDGECLPNHAPYTPTVKPPKGVAFTGPPALFWPLALLSVGLLLTGMGLIGEGRRIGKERA